MLFEEPMEDFKKALAKLKKTDPVFAKLAIKHKDLKFQNEAMRSPFESLVRSISHQQLHSNAAMAILGRLIARFGSKSFPTPRDLIKLPDSEFRLCGYSMSKTKAIKDIALKTIEGVIPDLETAQKLSNEELIDRMSAPFGVGKWTVEMFLIFALGRMDVWPVDDFGVRRGFMIWKRKSEMPKPKDLDNFGERWRPFRTVVALYLWKEADATKDKRQKARSFMDIRTSSAADELSPTILARGLVHQRLLIGL